MFYKDFICHVILKPSWPDRFRSYHLRRSFCSKRCFLCNFYDSTSYYTCSKFLISPFPFERRNCFVFLSRQLSLFNF